MDLPSFLMSTLYLRRFYNFLFMGLMAVSLFSSACTAPSGVHTAEATHVTLQVVANTPHFVVTEPTSQAVVTLTPIQSETSFPVTAVISTTNIPNTPALTPTPTLSATVQINGIPVSKIIILPPETAVHIREIYAHGQANGRNPNRFSKLGDSAVLVSSYLTRFDDPKRYTLGDWDYLQPTIDYYAGSFQRYGVATRVGLSSWAVFDPTWANKTYCNPNEQMLACEIRLFNPSVLLIHLGTNDIGPANRFDRNLRDILDYCLEQGVIPILSTKADRFEGDDNHNNEIIIQLAEEYQLPLWQYDAVAATLPDRGLAEDNIHLTTTLFNDYTDPQTWRSGYPVSDLTALLMFDTIRQTLEEVQP